MQIGNAKPPVDQSRMEIMDLAQELGGLSLLFENLGSCHMAEGQLYGIALLLKQIQKQAERIYHDLDGPGSSTETM